MKFLKYFEFEKKQFREIDLAEFFINYSKYKYKLVPPFNSDEKYWMISIDFNKNILFPLLIDKEIEFLRAIHPYDDEVIYGFSGRVKNIRIIKESDCVSYIVDLYESTKALYLFKIPLYKKLEPCFIKIYNSEPMSIENEIEMFLNVEKYNL